MGAHLYNSRFGKVAWFVRRFGAGGLVLDQVSSGLAVRMSILYHLLAGEGAS